MAAERERRLSTIFRCPIQTRPNSLGKFYVFRRIMKSAASLALMQ
jgi:hypothetical protein